MEKKRYYLIDSLRAVAIINMVLYHALWDIVNIIGINIPWYSGSIGHIWQQSICRSFIVISGFCFCMSRNNFRRGIIVFSAGVLISIVTAIFMPQTRILFGILTFIGSSMIFTALIDSKLKKINSLIGIIICVILFALTYDIRHGYISIAGHNIFRLPQLLYSGYFMTYLGFTDKHFYSGDYFPVIPWLFMYIGGYFLNKLVMKYEKVTDFLEKRCRFLEPAGRNSLLIYMLHQPVIYVIILAVQKS